MLATGIHTCVPMLWSQQQECKRQASCQQWHYLTSAFSHTMISQIDMMCEAGIAACLFSQGIILVHKIPSNVITIAPIEDGLILQSFDIALDVTIKSS